MDNVTIEHITMNSRKTGKPFECLKLTIGEWSTLVFPATRFEANYVFKIVDGLNNAHTGK